MNSLSSVLTYTDMDLAAILGKERSGARHQSSLGKQVVYFFIVLGIQIGSVSYKVDTSYILHIITRLTIVSLAYMAKNGGQVNMFVVDGSSQLLTTRHVGTILGISWGTFIISWITNAVYYKVREFINSLLSCVRYSTFV